MILDLEDEFMIHFGMPEFEKRVKRQDESIEELRSLKGKSRELRH
jgi:hypothetical protein